MFAPELSQPIPREFAPAGPVSMLPQQKVKGKEKGGTLTSGEIAERRNKVTGHLGGSKHVLALESPSTEPDVTSKTQECIHIIRSTAL